MREINKKILSAKYELNFTNSGMKTEKKGLHREMCKFWGEYQKKNFHCKICKKSTHEYWVNDQYFGVLRPRTELQWHRAYYFLWDTILALGDPFLAWGDTSSDLGARLRNTPRGAGPKQLEYAG